jgi:hypothetical protein
MGKTMSKAARARRRTAESWREFGKAEGRAAATLANSAAIEQLRADAQALETSARLLRDAPGYPVPHKAETIDALFAMASGMRLATDRIPDALDLPF